MARTGFASFDGKSYLFTVRVNLDEDIGELVFNMLVLVGSIKMSDRIIRELMGLG